MNQTRIYPRAPQAAAQVAGAALACLVLICGAGNVVAQPVTTGTDRWIERLPETSTPDTPQHVAKHFDAPQSDRSKYLLFVDPNFQLKGWTNGVVRWRYNDSGRNPSVSGAATAVETIATLQAAQAKWTAACNVQFIYEGTTTAVPTPNNMSAGNLDNISAVGWTLLPGSTTGVAGVAYSGSSQPLPIVEGDIAFNNAFSHNLSVTALHETGHLLGIDHSDVSNAVMSGPPLTSYTALNALQADDIAACVSLYGGPVPSSRMITGTITNGSALSGVTFCARPATGVTCTASNSAGAYSCTVPNGWSGLLHAPGPTGLRIKPQSFTNVTANLSGQNPVVQSIGACNLDVDNNGLIEPATDGVAILRRMLGIASGGFSGLSGTCAGNTTTAAIFGATTLAGYNVTGASAVRPTTDGAVILRAMRGLTGTAVTNSLGLAASGATRTDWTANLRNHINTTCGSDFLP